MNVIAVTGSVASGKTTVAKALAKKLKFEYVDVNKLISKNKLKECYDKKKKCHVVDVKKLVKVLVNYIKKSKKNLVIDSHFSHYLPKEYVDYCVVTKCGLLDLKSRLTKRKYSDEKIKENLDVEVFDSLFMDASERGHNVVGVDTSKLINISEMIELMGY